MSQLKLFISYRRDDGFAAGMVGRLYERLSERYGAENVFMDVDTIPPGVDFADHLDHAVAETDVLLAVMGRQWAEMIQARADEEDDFVRIEIERALVRGIPVVPLLVGNTTMPKSVDLPSSIASFSRRNGVPIDLGRDFNAHVTRLVDDLERHFGGGAIPRPAIVVSPPTLDPPALMDRPPLPPLDPPALMDIPLAPTPVQPPPSFPTLDPPAPHDFGRFSPGDEQFIDLANGVQMPFCYIPAGSFIMGSPDSEEGRSDDEVQHRVTLTKDFWMAKYPVTQEVWTAIMGSNPSYFKDAGDRAPVEHVSWDNAQEFCSKTNLRLPTEAEWEYACRAGTTGEYNVEGASLDELGWYDENSGKTTHPVGEKKPNAWGLHDCHGNVWEWCQDWYGDYPKQDVTDPTGPKEQASLRVTRGGGWDYDARGCRSAGRSADFMDFRCDDLGFRPVRSAQ